MAKAISDGSLLPLPYEITMACETGAGKPVKLTFSADGTLTPDHYTMNLPMRSVTQTVFGADGKPVPGGKVQASYAWCGVLHILPAQADAQGRVTWAALPPVPAIVWGDRVPASVLPCGGVIYHMLSRADSRSGLSTEL